MAAEMADVATAEDNIRRAAALLTPDGRWVVQLHAKKLYERLLTIEPRIFNPAIVRVVLGRETAVRELLFLAVKVGKRGSEQRLAIALDGYGDKDMAVAYLNCGSAELRSAATRWAARNGHQVHPSGGQAPVHWGSF